MEKESKVERALFISVKPEFVEKIFNGSKTIELRKSAPNINKEDVIIIYSTSPIMSVIGTCRVKEIIMQKPAKLWNEYSNKCGIDRKRYFEYYEGKDIAVGIVLKDVKKFNKQIPLSKLRSKFTNFHPPQTFRYFDEKNYNRLIQI